MRNSTGNADRKSEKTGENDKTKKNAGTCTDEKEKSIQKNAQKTIKLKEINQKVLVKGVKFIRYRQG